MQKLVDRSEAERLPGGYKTRTTCRLCGSPELRPVLSLRKTARETGTSPPTVIKYCRRKSD